MDEPRLGVPRPVSDEEVERVVVRMLQSLPRRATQWRTRSMAAPSGTSRTTVSRIWRSFGLKPHPQETFWLSNAPLSH